MVSHPIQYQAPLLRRIAAEPGISLRVLFERVDPANTYFDTGFQRDVSWDVPLTEGYDNAALADVDMDAEIAKADAIWLHGWQTKTLRRILSKAHARDIPTLMRGENCRIAMPDGSGLKGWAKRRYLDHLFRKCRGFLTIGSMNRAYYADHGIPDDRMFDVPYAIDNERFAHAASASAPERAAMKESLGIAPQDRVILFAGKLMKRKHARLLVEAVQHTPALKETRLLIVGDGEERAALERAAPTAIFTGFINQNDLPAYYALADVFVLPSEREPWGLAVNEAMASGTAVVVSDQVGCAPDLVTPGVGRIFNANDRDALGRALTDVLADADAMGVRAQERIRTWSFDQDIVGLRRALETFGLLSQ